MSESLKKRHFTRNPDSRQEPPMPTATASGKLLEPILQLASHYKATSDEGLTLQQELLADAGLSQQDLSRPDARFPTDNFSRVLDRLIQASDNPQIPIRLAEATQPRMLGSLGFLISTSDTLEQAFAVLEDYLPILFEDTALERIPSGDHTRLTLRLRNTEQNVAEFFLACLINWPRWLTGKQIPIRQVDIAFPEPDNPSLYRQLFAAEVRFDTSANSIELPNRYLKLPCLDANREMHQLHKEFADALLSKSEQKQALTARVRALIRQQLLSEHEAIRREEIARELGLSLRTLQRKLVELDTNFQELYDQTRKELCLQLIRKGALSFGEIAFQLGFSNQSAFQKAFKRWTGMAPSHYRRQNLSTADAKDTQTDKPTRSAMSDSATVVTAKPSLLPGSGSESGTENALAEQLKKLNPFGLKTLQQAAVYGEVFRLDHLSQLAGDPTARLMIHLWPAQQEGLIHPVTEHTDRPEFRFTEASTRRKLMDQIPHETRQTLHEAFARILLMSAAFPQHAPNPELPDTAGKTLIQAARLHPIPETVRRALAHLNVITERYHDSDKTPPLSIGHLTDLNQQAAFQALEQADSAGASEFLRAAQQWLSLGGAPQTYQLQQARLYLKTGDLTRCEHWLQQLEQTSLAAELKVPACLLRARTLQQRHQTASALNLLQQLAQPALPVSDPDQLMFLLHTLEQIQQLRKAQPNDAVQSRSPEAMQEQLPLLEALSTLAGQQAKPLLAACAISQMTFFSLQLPETPYTRYAFVGYAWVASWFCGDYRLCREILSQGLALGSGQSPQASEPIYADNDSANLSRIATELRHCSQIQHWLEPMGILLNHLRQLGEACRKAGDPLTNAQQRILWFQLNTLASEHSLSRIRQRAQPDYDALLKSHPPLAQQLKEASLLLADYLQGKANLPAEARYQSPEQAVSLIRAALLLNQQALWPQFADWQARLENERPGYFMLTESLFALSLMRLILAQQQPTADTQTLRQAEQTESRFELWARHCPENFSGQWHLLRAEKLRLSVPATSEKTSTETPEQHYEAALAAFRKTGVVQHIAFTLERYCDYLQIKQPALSGFCQQEALRLYQSWGANAKVVQLSPRKIS